MASTTLVFLDFGYSKMQEVGALKGRILTCKGDGSGLKVLLADCGTFPDGLVVTENHIFYTLMGNPSANDGSIARIDLDGSNWQIIVPKGHTFTPKQMNLDRVNKKIYWCDREGMKVMRANFDGSEHETIISSGDGEEDRKDQRRWCVGIAVDPKHGRFYWTQKGPSKGNQGRIFYASIDMPAGKDACTRDDIKVLFDKLPEPIDLDVDEETNTLYFSDRGEIPLGNSISRVNLDDPNLKKELLIRKLHEAIGLTLDVPNHMMYFADLAGGLYSATMDGKDEKTLIADGGDLTGVACFPAVSNGIAA